MITKLASTKFSGIELSNFVGIAVPQFCHCRHSLNKDRTTCFTNDQTVLIMIFLPFYHDKKNWTSWNEMEAGKWSRILIPTYIHTQSLIRDPDPICHVVIMIIIIILL